MAAAAGWPWAALLVGWFVISSALTKLGAAEKARRTAASLAPGGPRTALQVWANGGAYAACSLAATLSGDVRWSAAALGALAAATADTWATEVGTWLGGQPRSVLSWRPVDPGLSGGVTLVGSLGGLVGAMAIALVGARVAPVIGAPAIALAGIAGSLGDSLLGASVQVARWCPRCRRGTERATHDCGVATEPWRGWRWMTNDTVNLLATFIGAGTAVLCQSLLVPPVP